MHLLGPRCCRPPSNSTSQPHGTGALPAPAAPRPSHRLPRRPVTGAEAHAQRLSLWQDSAACLSRTPRSPARRCNEGADSGGALVVLCVRHMGHHGAQVQCRIPNPCSVIWGVWRGGRGGGGWTRLPMEGGGGFGGVPASPVSATGLLLRAAGGGGGAAPPTVGLRFLYGPLTGTRPSLRMLRPVAAFCRPLWPVYVAPFSCQRGPVVGALGLCWLLLGGCFTVVAAHSPPHPDRPPHASPRFRVHVAQSLHASSWCPGRPPPASPRCPVRGAKVLHLCVWCTWAVCAPSWFPHVSCAPPWVARAPLQASEIPRPGGG